MEKLIKKIARRFGTQPDKVKHVAVSAMLVVMIYIGLVFLGVDAAQANLLALAITLLIGFTKEVADRFTGGDSSVADMTANVLGAVPVALFIWLFGVVLRQM